MIDDYGIHLGPLYIHFYALILLSGMLAAAWFTARRARAAGFDATLVWDGLMWALIPGLIGARIYHILTPTPASGLSLEYYLRNPLQMFAIWNGGLGIYGAVVGGAIGVYIYGRRKQQPILRWFDIIIPAAALAQAIGRWGNFVNQEVYGAPTTLPWAIYIAREHRIPGYTSVEYYHPLFLYESILNLLTLGSLLLIERRFKDRLRPGDLFLIYLLFYPTIRFGLDYLRLDSNGFGPLTTAQLVSLLTILASVAILVLRHRRAMTAVPAQNSPES